MPDAEGGPRITFDTIIIIIIDWKTSVCADIFHSGHEGQAPKTTGHPALYSADL
jgi:hypothetical protein